MKRILDLNLIRSSASQIQGNLKLLSYIRLGYLGCAVVFLVLLLNWIIVGFEIHTNRNKTELLKAKIKTERDTMGIDNLETEWKNYLSQVAKIESIVSKRTLATAMFYELSKALPMNAYLSAISFDLSNGVDIRMDISASEKGLAPGASAITGIMDFMDTLKKRPLFGDNVKVDSQEKTTASDHETSIELFKISIQKTSGA